MERMAKAGDRIQTTVRKPLAAEIKRLAEKTGRTESEMAAHLLDQAVQEMAAKGLAEAV